MQLTISSANEIERGIVEGLYHAGIVPLHHAVEGIDHEYVFTEDVRLYCGDRHPFFAATDDDISFTDLRSASYVDWGYFVNRNEFDARIEFSPGATVFNNEGAAILILSGRHIGFLPVHYAEQWVANGRMRSLLPDLAYYRKPMALVYKRNLAQNLMIAKFSECLRDAHE